MKTSAEAPARRKASIEAKRAAVSPGPQLMDPAAARWVLDVVLTWRKGEPDLPCSCLFGPCGRCGRGECRRGGQHDVCLNTSRPSAYYGTEETWMTPRPGWAMGVPVWLADRTCRYRCPCPCTTEPMPNPLPAPPPLLTEPLQESLW